MSTNGRIGMPFSILYVTLNQLMISNLIQVNLVKLTVFLYFYFEFNKRLNRACFLMKQRASHIENIARLLIKLCMWSFLSLSLNAVSI